MPQMTGAAAGVSPWIFLMVALVLLLAGAMIFDRLRWLGQRHDQLEQRCDGIERTHAEATSRMQRMETSVTSIDARLTEIRQDGKRNTEMLHVLITGHVAASKD
ncbi:hypothetical protein D3W54_06985 [Komagataeibacter medellinensis]|uniref:Uncharacterized protein n=1 Tax=Komagataeibacter medellinensis TaxID=1177712 RepID=A0ABQ6VUV4_9PROT|nr:hypothetical protein [Komagataeibacter medellinensis]KAB8123986.1 hypothetical protein D3W54_06985 [Komagataeibacter medellinensis]